MMDASGIKRGVFIVLSGGEGSGKSSVLKAIQPTFPEAVFTREPGGTAVGAKIRAILLDHGDDPSPWTDLFLFFADRAQHVAEVVQPALQAGKVVFSDRYLPDTYAYQWFAAMGQRDPAVFLQLANAAAFPMPDLWLWLDVDPQEGLRRRRGTDKQDRMDRKDLAFHTSVREGFASLLTIDPWKRIGRRIDANQSFAAVVADVADSLQAFMRRAKG